VVWLVVLSDLSHGTHHAIGLILDAPVLGALLLVTWHLYRWSRKTTESH